MTGTNIALTISTNGGDATANQMTLQPGTWIIHGQVSMYAPTTPLTVYGYTFTITTQTFNPLPSETVIESVNTTNNVNLATIGTYSNSLNYSFSKNIQRMSQMTSTTTYYLWWSITCDNGTTTAFVNNDFYFMQ